MTEVNASMDLLDLMIGTTAVNLLIQTSLMLVLAVAMQRGLAFVLGSTRMREARKDRHTELMSQCSKVVSERRQHEIEIKSLNERISSIYSILGVKNPQSEGNFVNGNVAGANFISGRSVRDGECADSSTKSDNHSIPDNSLPVAESADTQTRRLLSLVRKGNRPTEQKDLKRDGALRGAEGSEGRSVKSHSLPREGIRAPALST